MTEVYSSLARGGIIMIPLLLSSVLALAIVIERFISLRRSKILIPEIISVVEEFNSTEDIKLATNICEKNKGAFANIVLTGLQNNDLTPEEVRELLVDQGRQEVRTLERGLPALPCNSAKHGRPVTLCWIVGGAGEPQSSQSHVLFLPL